MPSCSTRQSKPCVVLAMVLEPIVETKYTKHAGFLYWFPNTWNRAITIEPKKSLCISSLIENSKPKHPPWGKYRDYCYHQGLEICKDCDY